MVLDRLEAPLVITWCVSVVVLPLVAIAISAAARFSDAGDACATSGPVYSTLDDM